MKKTGNLSQIDIRPDQSKPQAQKDRVRSNIEYEVNVKAEMEVAFLHEKTDRLYEKMQEQFSRVEKAIALTRVRNP